MERRNGLHPTVTRQERSRGTRKMPLIDLSYGRLSSIKLPDDFPGPDATAEEARDYLLARTYSHRGYSTRIPTSHGLNYNSHH